MKKNLFSNIHPYYSSALGVCFNYAIFSSLWISLSDRVLLSLTDKAELLTQIQTAKGWIFVIISALFLYLLLHKKIDKIMHAEKSLQEIFNSTREAIFLHDAATEQLIDINQAAIDMLGYSLEEIRQLTISDLHIEKQATDTKYSHNPKVKASGRFVRQIHRKNGDTLWVEISSQKFDTEVKGQRITTVRDITTQKTNEDVLRTLAETSTSSHDDIFKTMAKQIAVALKIKCVVIGSIDPLDSSTVNSVTAWETDRFIDLPSYSLMGTPCENVISRGMCAYPDKVDQLFPEDDFLVDLGLKSYLGVPLRNSHGRVLGLIALLDNKPMEITDRTLNLLESLAVRASIELERKKSDEKLKLSSRVFTDTREGIIITDPSGKIVDVNPTFCSVTGYSRDEVIGKTPSLVSSGKHSPQFYEDMWQKIYSDGFWQGEVSNRKKNGEPYDELLSISSLENKAGEIINFVGVFTDITQSKKQQRQLEIMAHYDVLTNLPNRTLFSDRFTQACAQSKRNETSVAVCFLDLDRFKPVNDTYGHMIGDRLLVEVAGRIKSNIREEDTVSRQGGDEFAVLLVNLESPFQGEQMLDRIQSTLAQPYYINGHTITISASMGVTLYPSDNSDLDKLLRHADQAMYQAKLSGRNNYLFFNIEDAQKTVNKHQQLQEISDALQDNQFHLYYQPKVNLRTGKVFGVEALIRWQHPEQGLIPPADFLPIIEGHSLENKVGNWVIQQAIKQMEQWQNKNIFLEVSINIASQHLLTPNFCSELNTALSQCPTVDSQYLQLEILESSILSDLATITSVLLKCQNSYGVSFALDDFGTGYSSLTHLRNLPVDIIKIDKSFVINVLKDPNDYAIIDGLIGLTTSFGLELIAEGVETNEIALMLLLMGCENIQGYGLARPMPAGAFKQWLSNYLPDPIWQEYIAKYKTSKQKHIQLCRMTIQQWKDQFESSVLSDTGTSKNWPVFDSSKCHCSSWIKRQRQLKLIDNQLLDSFHEEHEKMHVLATDIHRLYTRNNKNDVQLKLNELKEAFNNASTILDKCLL